MNSMKHNQTHNYSSIKRACAYIQFQEHSSIKLCNQISINCMLYPISINIPSHNNGLKWSNFIYYTAYYMQVQKRILWLKVAHISNAQTFIKIRIERWKNKRLKSHNTECIVTKRFYSVSTVKRNQLWYRLNVLLW